MEKEITLKLAVKVPAHWDLWERKSHYFYGPLRQTLDRFVIAQWILIWEGACSLERQAPRDCIAIPNHNQGARVFYLKTRVKSGLGVEYDHGHSPDEAELRQNIRDIQSLIDAAAVPGRGSFTLYIVKVKNNQGAMVP